MSKWIQDRDANWRIPYTGGWCLKYVADAFGGTAEFSTNAMDAWNRTQFKHYDLPPAGITVPVWFSLGNVWQGHVAVRLDDLMVASSTQGGDHSQGYIHSNIQDMINLYGQYNGGCTYLGWSEDLLGTRIVHWQEDPVVVVSPVVIPAPPIIETPSIIVPEPVIPPEPIVEPPVIVPDTPVVIEPPIIIPTVVDPLKKDLPPVVNKVNKSFIIKLIKSIIKGLKWLLMIKEK